MNEPVAETPPHILVVDDTPGNLQIVGETLTRQMVCDLSFATDGPQALEAVRSAPPDLILLDVMMPGMSGYTVCRILKSDPATAAIPILFLTAKADSHDVVAGFEAGAVDYIQKPFNAAELAARVKTQIKIRKAAEALQASEDRNRLLQKSESLSRMAGAIAHNFNNQLQALMGNLELAADSLPAGSETGGLIADALKATRKAAELSSLMLTYLGQSRFEAQPVDLVAICRDRLKELRASQPAQVRMETAWPVSGLVIRAHAAHIQQLLAHLVLNAWESLGTKPGQVRVALYQTEAERIAETHRFPPDWSPGEPTYACLEVSDTGCGIAEAEIEQIFDPFYTTKFPGRGMGLPVVLGVVRALGGAVCVESQPDKGTTMRAYLPPLIGATS